MFDDLPGASMSVARPSPRELFFRYKKHALALLITAGIFLVAYGVLAAPRAFPAPTIITIERGSSLIGMSGELKEKHIIRSETLFQMLAIIFTSDKKLPAGDYAFEEKVPVYVVAWRIANGEHGIARKKVTIPEGSTVRDIAKIASSALINFDSAGFIAETEAKEGYLFPDTYFFFSNATPKEVIAVLERTFNEKTAVIRNEPNTRSFADIITMASIIEGEANKPADRLVVAGILWKRIDEGMRLQVDAPFQYLNQERGDTKVTAADLAINSPYNTYKNDGLPPGPIGNPGLDAITAAAQPEKSPYWYYIHDNDGIIHYAKTFEEHKANIKKYLKD